MNTLGDYNWDRFYLHMYFHAPIDEVFAAWSTPKGQATFFVRECNAFREKKPLSSDTTLQPGDTYEYLWEDGAESKGKILDVNSSTHTIVFSFGDAKVRVQLENRPLGVLLELKHYDIPKEQQSLHQLECRVGWTHFLVNLKCVLEKGADIREANPKCAGTLAWGIHPPQDISLS